MQPASKRLPHPRFRSLCWFCGMVVLSVLIISQTLAVSAHNGGSTVQNTGRALQNENHALLRFVNASPDGPIDIYLDSTPVVTNLAYKAATDYGSVPIRANSYRVRVFRAGDAATGTPAMEGTIVVSEMTAQTFVVYNHLASPDQKGQLLIDDMALPSADAAARFFHAAIGAPLMVDVVQADGTTLFNDIAFGHSSLFEGVAADSYTLQVQNSAANTVLNRHEGIALNKGTIQMLVLSGTADGSVPLELWAVPYPAAGSTTTPALLLPVEALAMPTAAEGAAPTVAAPAALTTTPTPAPVVSPITTPAATGGDAFPTAAPATPGLPVTGGPAETAASVWGAQLLLLAGLLVISASLFGIAYQRRHTP